MNPNFYNSTPSSSNLRRIPGEVGIWVFISGDLLIFSLFFAVFLYYRTLGPEIFQRGQTCLNPEFGFVNAVLMLSSSWFVATAVRSARLGLHRTTSGFFLAGFFCGACFIVIKYFEYSHEINLGYTLNSNIFFSFYYMLTGIHLLHVCIGMGVLALMARFASSGTVDAAKLRNFESGASFWHVVDLLWIVLFPLLYLVK